MRLFPRGAFPFLAILLGWAVVVFSKPNQQIDDTAAGRVSNILEPHNATSPTNSTLTSPSIFVNSTRPIPITQNNASTFLNDSRPFSNLNFLFPILTNQTYNILHNLSLLGTIQQFHFPYLHRPTHENLLVELRAADSTTTEQTPYLDIVAYNRQLKSTRDRNAFGLDYGSNCMVYGSEIKLRQETGNAFSQKEDQILYTSKELDDEFPSKICRISQRLECIPDKSADSIAKPTPEPLPGSDGGGETGLLSDDITTTVGVCRCLRALGDRSIYVPADPFRKIRAGCYIPAGFAESSGCGHVVPLPYGVVNTVAQNPTFPDKEIPIVQRHVGNSSLLCVPNAECRISRNFIGTRCVCRKDSIWHLNGTCEKIFTRKDLENIGYRLFSMTTFGQTLIVIQVIQPMYQFYIFGNIK